jgi:threonine dehydrogenase-like Zn-dependent dehydrogenase
MALRSPNVALVGKHPEKMAIAAKKGPRPMLTSDISGDLFGTFDVVVEASGSESGFASALDLVRPRGKIVLKSTFNGTPSWPASRIVVDEITVVGSRCGRFRPALELLKNKDLPVDDLISDQYPLTDGVAAFERAAETGVLKVLLSAGR